MEALSNVGNRSDLQLFNDNRWLTDATVKSMVKQEKGRWTVYLLFVSRHDPLQFIIRKINHYCSRGQAETCAEIYRRGANKDPRGNVNTDEKRLNIFPN